MLPLLVGLILGAAIPSTPPVPVPFGPGERFDYVAKLDILKLGSARMEVTSIDSVQGHEAYLLRMQIDIGTIFYKAHDSLASWLDTETLSTRRFWKRQQNSDAKRTETFQIFPEERRFFREGKPHDVRESPAVKVINLLHRRGALLAFHDPYIDSIAMNGGTLHRTDLTNTAVARADLVAVLTPHTAYDLEWVADHAKLVFDTRNAYDGGRRDNVIRL